MEFSLKGNVLVINDKIVNIGFIILSKVLRFVSILWIFEGSSTSGTLFIVDWIVKNYDIFTNEILNLL